MISVLSPILPMIKYFFKFMHLLIHLFAQHLYTKCYMPGTIQSTEVQ